ncbi:MAG: asparagine synthase (glutamine-hydrolyzing) [Vicinamibacterales bacterium]
MCGIAGYVNLDGAPADAGVVATMMRAIRHRGPDDRGHLLLSLRGNDITDSALGFHRLNILDLSEHGHQPMVNPSGTIVIAFNGEIYNAFDYKSELEAAGFQFRSRTDTEVLLYLYEHYGLPGMLERLNGMFAIVIADLRTHQVHIARDHFGIKPLYWTQAGSSVLFASEAKAFLEHPAFIAEIDEAHVDEQLAFRYVAGEASLLKGVRQLRPGHRLTITPDGVTTTRYWSIPDGVEKAQLTRQQAVDQLDDLLRSSVASQLLSDVKVGCQLSGGIDSSLVTMFAGSQSGAARDTFSVVFEDPKFSEDRWITEAAAAATARAHRYMFTEASFSGGLERAAWHMDQPISHPNSLGLWLLAEQSRERVTVLLSGEGADEVFAGYARFASVHAPSQPGNAVEAFIRATQFQPASKLAKLRPSADLSAPVARRAALFQEGRGDHLSNCLKYEMQTYLVDLLIRQDKMTMAHGVENRVPFLDRRVVDFARTLPAVHLVGDTTKVVVKELARRSFPDAFVFRPKGAFNLPLSQYFRSAAFTERMEDLLLPGISQRGLISEPAVRELWRRSLSAPALTEVLWIPVALELWAQSLIKIVD